MKSFYEDTLGSGSIKGRFIFQVFDFAQLSDVLMIHLIVTFLWYLFLVSWIEKNLLRIRFHVNLLRSKNNWKLSVEWVGQKDRPFSKSLLLYRLRGNLDSLKICIDLSP